MRNPFQLKYSIEKHRKLSERDMPDEVVESQRNRKVWLLCETFGKKGVVLQQRMSLTAFKSIENVVTNFVSKDQDHRKLSVRRKSSQHIEVTLRWDQLMYNGEAGQNLYYFTEDYGKKMGVLV